MTEIKNIHILLDENNSVDMQMLAIVENYIRKLEQDDYNILYNCIYKKDAKGTDEIKKIVQVITMIQSKDVQQGANI